MSRKIQLNLVVTKEILAQHSGELVVITEPRRLNRHRYVRGLHLADLQDGNNGFLAKLAAVGIEHGVAADGISRKLLILHRLRIERAEGGSGIDQHRFGGACDRGGDDEPASPHRHVQRSNPLQMALIGFCKRNGGKQNNRHDGETRKHRHWPKHNTAGHFPYSGREINRAL